MVDYSGQAGFYTGNGGRRDIAVPKSKLIIKVFESIAVSLSSNG